jgi:DNA polymerase-3 subunit gamma/tau
VSDSEFGSLFPEAPVSQQAGAAYRVLARKYRPSNFAELIGQDALVRTLTNAFAQNRIAHAFMLTGVRGVGKTTTARIIARALNCAGPDGKGGPTISPCGVCDNCVAIAADRHVDVMEMDAASRTGIDDIRDLIEGVRYAPAAARYKVYIIDEVHMLSKQAFNALLKTLEEPPPHVKFVFATTEIRKVPITVLSRCQRFDLRRVDPDVLIAHFDRIAAAEGVTAEPDAMAMIARAADGSVRDGLSLLDQAIARGFGAVAAEQVRDMLGLADRAIVFDLFEAAMGGDAKGALAIMAKLHAVGADPATIIEDLLDLTHAITRMRLAGGGTRGADLELKRGGALAERLSMPVLTRTWQLLLKGVGELQNAPVPYDAAEMIVLRLAYAADLPSPAELVRQLQGETGRALPAPRAFDPTPRAADPSPRGGGSAFARAEPAAPPAALARPEAPAVSQAPEALQVVPAPEPLADPKTFRALVRLFAEKREGVLEYHLASSVRLVRFEPGVIEFNPLPAAPANLANRVGTLLSAWTGRRWMVGISSAPGAAPLAEAEQAERTAAFDAARLSPTVQALLEAFPGATITDVRDLAPTAAEAENITETPYPADSGEPLDSGDEP